MAKYNTYKTEANSDGLTMYINGKVALENATLDDVEMTGRTEQVNLLRELAGNLAALHRSEDISAEEIVEWYLTLGDNDAPVEMPGWFDDHDHNLLIEWVKDAQQLG